MQKKFKWIPPKKEENKLGHKILTRIKEKIEVPQVTKFNKGIHLCA